MTLHLYNTLTRAKEPFKPHGHRVGVYVCGVTVWDSTHLGHGRAATVFDCLVRYLRHLGHEVTFVRNYTDVDDKIINRANAEHVSWQEIAQRYSAEYAADMAGLGNQPPDIEPRASDHISEMIALIEQLIARGKAYAVNGDVYFAVREFAEYGKLSGKKIEELEVGARIELNEAKRDPLDFALWKAVKPGEPSWPSPWGAGRPGWHIECSAMSCKYLGQPFEIHGGGRDLIFPHHENEIAQSEAATGKEFVRCWVHNGSLTIDNEKMSKSLGNYFKTSEALKQYDREVLRYFLLSSHYRSPLDFTESALADAARAVERIYETAARVGIPQHEGDVALAEQYQPQETQVLAAVTALPSRVTDALNDDFNTPKVFGALFDAIREVNRYLDSQPAHDSACFIELQQAWHRIRKTFDEILGLFGSDPAVFQQRLLAKRLQQRGLDVAVIERLIEQRRMARVAKDFAAADLARAELDRLGVVLKDAPDGSTHWRFKE